MLMANQLVGFGVGGGPPTSTALFDSSTSGSETITAPATISAGDLLFLLDYAFDSVSNPTQVVPTGFSQVLQFDDGLIQMVCTYKVADGSESGATITGMTADFDIRKVLLQFRPNRPAKNITIQDTDAQESSADPTAQTVTSSSGIIPFIVFGIYCTSISAIDPRSFSTTKDGEVNRGTATYFAFKSYNSGDTPENVVIDMDDEGAANMLASFYAEIS